ncbi:unnamed protein product, partial [marine sediment metagenome]
GFEFLPGMQKKQDREMLKIPQQMSLAEGFSLSRDEQTYCIFKEIISGLQFIRHNQAIWESGLYVELTAYQYQVFIDFSELKDNEFHHYAELCSSLAGRGVPDLNDALIDIILKPVQQSFSNVYNSRIIQYIVEHKGPSGRGVEPAFLDDIEKKAFQFFQSVEQFLGSRGDGSIVIEETAAKELHPLLEAALLQSTDPDKALSGASAKKLHWHIIYCWIILSTLIKAIKPGYDFDQRLIDDLRLEWVIRPVWHNLGLNAEKSAGHLLLLKILLQFRGWLFSPAPRLQEILETQEAKQYLQVNRYKSILWFNKEAFETLLFCFYFLRKDIISSVRKWIRMAKKVNYRFEKLMELIMFFSECHR